MELFGVFFFLKFRKILRDSFLSFVFFDLSSKVSFGRVRGIFYLREREIFRFWVFLFERGGRRI